MKSILEALFEGELSPAGMIIRLKSSPYSGRMRKAAPTKTVTTPASRFLQQYYSNQIL
jgi:hypothetical protein